MIKEAYCSYEVSKLLKEKGFAAPCNSWYMLCNNGSVKTGMLTESANYNHYDGFPWTVSRSTHQMALAWLREMHNIFIIVNPYSNTNCYFSLWQGDNYYENPLKKNFSSYEETVEAALKYCLENLI